MELIAKINELHDSDEHAEIISLITGTESYQENAELVGLLARAYNNVERYEEAVQLLLSVKASEDAIWNYRIGYSYIFMDKDYKAIEHLNRAKEIDPDQEADCDQLLEMAYNNLKLPQFTRPFCDRVTVFWEEFAGIEEELRTMMDNKVGGEAIVEKISTIADKLADDVYMELGKSDKHEMIFTLEGEFHRVFLYDYLISQMPEELGENWRFIVARQPMANADLVMNNKSINADDVVVRIDKSDDKSIEITLYCEKLHGDEQSANMIVLLLEGVLGEVCCYRLLAGTEFASEKIEGILLSELPKKLTEMGLDTSSDHKKLIDGFTAYQMDPNNDEDAPLRADVITGISKSIPLLAEYMNGSENIINDYHNFGAVAGFLIFNKDAFEDKSEDILSFRYKLEEEISAKTAGLGIIIGGAVGTDMCYIDFIAYQTKAFLESTISVFEENGVDFLGYSAMRASVEPLLLI